MSRRSRSGARGLPYDLLLFAVIVGALGGLSGWLGVVGRALGGWIILISIVTFIAFVLDKSAARRSGGRTSERGLLLLVALGGTLGGGLAMLLVRHKTAKGSFLRSFWWVVGMQAAGWLLAGALQGQIRALAG